MLTMRVALTGTRWTPASCEADIGIAFVRMIDSDRPAPGRFLPHRFSRADDIHGNGVSGSGSPPAGAVPVLSGH